MTEREQKQTAARRGNSETADFSAWQQRYLQQHSCNLQLETQLRQLQRRRAVLESQTDSEHERSASTLDTMSEVGMRQLLRQLGRERGEVDWRLRDCEWRLDQEATAVHKAEEEKATLLTELGQASLELEKCQANSSQRGKPPPAGSLPKTLKKTTT